MVTPTVPTTWNIGPAEHARLLAEADADPVGFWEAAARQLEWAEPWHTAHTWDPAVPDPDRPGELTVPAAEWFVGGRLNAAVNCVDRHVAAGRGGTVALHFEGERGDRRSLTYAELHREVSRAAGALTSLGVGPGDRVVIYLPVLPETVIATLAVARIGAIASLVFCGFSAEALRHRVADVGARLVVTSDGQFRSGAAVPTKPTADAAVAGLGVAHVLVVRRTGADVPWTPGRDVWWHDVVATAPDTHVADAFDAEAPLLIVHTSGTTGRPKGLVHSTGGFLTQAAWTHWAVFDARPGDVHWCTADLAWVTGHTYALFGPLANGVTVVIYEGTPHTPHPARHAEIIDRYGVTTYYTAPTLIRSLMAAFPDGFPAEHDLSSIRLLGTVGEPINPEVWRWYRKHVGGGRVPVVDTWWQSETGAAMVAPLPGLAGDGRERAGGKPGSAGRPLPGISVAVVDDAGAPLGPGHAGLLVVDRPWPAMARTVWGDPERYRDAYWARFAGQAHGGPPRGRGRYLSGDGARWDADGDLWLLGRVDDVINVSGHRLSTIEVESALVEHPDVAEAGVAGVTDAVTGQAITAFVIPSRPPPLPDATGHDDAAAWVARTAHLGDALRAHVASTIGPIARPRDVVIVPDLPRTRSGKIMRRLLADLVAGDPLGDVTSLQDASVVPRIAAVLAARRGESARNVDHDARTRESA